MLAGDHIYKMDYERMLEQHVGTGADVTIGCLEVPRMEATGFGVMHVDAEDRIVSFLEKPKDPPGMPDKPDMALASMGIYVFEREFLFEELRRDAADLNSSHDFGKNLIPYLVEQRQGHGPPLLQLVRALEQRGGSLLARCRHGRRLLGGQHRPHRRHSGPRSLRSELADLDQCRAHRAGEVRPRFRRSPRHGDQHHGLRRLHRLRFERAPLALFTGVRVDSYSNVEGAVVLPYARIGRHVRLKNVVVDRGVVIPEGLVVGEDPELDAKRFRRTEKGICLITQDMIDRI